MRAKLVDKIFENPNAINYNGKEVAYDSDAVVPFAYYYNELVTGERGDVHSELKRKNSFRDDGGRTQNSGRLFTEQKIISFWRFPKDQNELLKVLKDLEEELNMIIIDDPEWKIEIPARKDDLEAIKNNQNWGKWGAKEIYIPIKDYKGSIERNKEELEQKHILSPILKKDRSVPSFVGSKRYQTKKPLAWRQALVPESLKIIL